MKEKLVKPRDLLLEKRIREQLEGKNAFFGGLEYFFANEKTPLEGKKIEVITRSGRKFIRTANLSDFGPVHPCENSPNVVDFWRYV
jgi:hypothetical protein